MKKLFHVVGFFALSLVASFSQTSYPTNATLKWTLTVDHGPLAASLTLAPDGTLYVATGDGASLTAINTSSQVARWTVPTNGVYSYGGATPVIAPNGTIYASINNNYSAYPISLGGIMSAFNPTNGSVLWDFPVQFANEASIFAPPVAVGNDGTIYVASDYYIYAITNAFGVTNIHYTDTNLYPYSLTNVGIKWIYYNESNNFASDSSYSTPAVGADGTIYEVGRVVESAYPNYGFQLFAFNPTNGALKWTTLTMLPTNNYGLCSSPAIGSDGTIYYGAGNDFIAVNPNSPVTNGIMGYKWVYDDLTTNADGLWVDSFSCNPVIGPDGTIYAEIGDGYAYINSGGSNELFAINPTTGVPKWTINLGIQPINYGAYNWKHGSLAIASDGEIYMADGNGIVYSFAPNGTTNWIYQTDGEGLNSPLIGPDGTVYVGSIQSLSNPDYVFAFAGPAPVACSFWPEDGRNARRTTAVALGQVTSPAQTTNGFGFTISTYTNMPVCSCASTDLVNWTNIGQVNLTGSSTNFVDTQARNYQHRFYRAMPQ